MAKLKGILNITGTLDELSMYRMRGVDDIIVRRKGGPSREMIKKSDDCIRIRENNTEFSTCSRMGGDIRHALTINTFSSNYNSSGKLNGVLMQILKKDDQCERGKRGIMLSKNRELLENFDFGKQHTFIGVVKRLPVIEINRTLMSANVIMPEIDGERDIYNFAGKSWMRFDIKFSVISDLAYDEVSGKALPINESYHGYCESYQSEWYPTKGTIPAHEVTLLLSEKKVAQLAETDSLIVAITLYFGDVGANGQPSYSKYAAASRIFMVR